MYIYNIYICIMYTAFCILLGTGPPWFVNAEPHGTFCYCLPQQRPVELVQLNTNIRRFIYIFTCTCLTKPRKNVEFPNATKHPVNKELLVAAAIGTRPADKERVAALAAAGVDAIIIDSSQGDSVFQHEMIK